MASFAVVAEGQRCTVKLTPMQPLSVAVEQARQKLKLTGSASMLKLGNKALDLNLPARFANIPAGSKLDLDTGAASQLGVQPNAQSASSSVPAGSAELPHTPAALQHQQPATSSQPSPVQTSSATPNTTASARHTAHHLPEPALASRPIPSATDRPQHLQASLAHPQQQSRDPAAGYAPAGSASSPSPSQGVATSHAASQPSLTSQSQSIAPQASSNHAQPATDAPPEWQSRNVKVFSRIAAEQQEAASSSVDEPPPEFYDFTAEDYHRAMASKQAAAARTSVGMKTSAMRQADMEAAAAHLGPICIRIHFPDDVVVQAEFKALEALSALQQLVQQIVSPGIRAWQLYTTPPKQIIRDWSPSFFQAHLVPAAHVYFTNSSPSTATNGSSLKADVLALMAEPPLKAVAHPTGGTDHNRPSASNTASARVTSEGAGLAGAGGGGGRSSAAAGKQPKWMKLGK